MDFFEGSYQTYSQQEEELSPSLPIYIEDHVLQNYAMAQQHASMLSMSNSATRATETKPRLAKEDVAFLERAFDSNHKPSTQTKRGYAESMGVDLPRINNWFQNRRAKQKNLRRQEEFRNSQCQDGLTMTQSEPSSPDEEDGHTFFGESILPLQTSATFPMMNGPPPAVAPCNPHYANPANASLESLQRTLAAAHAAQHNPPHQQFDNSLFESSQATMSFAGLPQDLASNDCAQFPAPESVSRFDANQHYSFSSPTNSIYPSTAPFSEAQHGSQDVYDSTPKPFMASFPSEIISNVPQISTTFPSQLIPSQNHDGHSVDESDVASSADNSDFASTPAIRYEIQESEDFPAAPPSSSLLRAPPSADIASRRPKVHNKPAALGLNISRGRPQMGPRTVSHAADGYRRSSDSPMASPMRRIVSAGGNRSGMPGRIQKPTVESAQRSPINLGGFSDAGAFMERNFHNIRNPPVLTPSFTSLAPPTPLSPRDRLMNGIHAEGPGSDASPTEGPNYVYTGGNFTAASVHQHENHIKGQNGEQGLTSPPVTPENALGLNIPTNYEWDNADFHGNGLYDVPDAPIFTPAHDHFNLEIQMPQPAYIHSLSQPVTPAVFQYPPNVFLNQDSSPLEGEPDLYPQAYPSQQEYTFPGSHSQLYISPIAKQKTFQFSNSTPADFTEK